MSAMTVGTDIAASPISAADVRRISLASFACYNVAGIAAWIQPAMVSEYVTVRGLPADLAGLLASIEMVLIAAVMMAWSRYAVPVRYRTMAVVGAVMALAAAGLSMIVQQFAFLLAVRAVAAVGLGLLMLVPSMAIAALPAPQIAYARMYSISLVCSALVLLAMPSLALLIDRPPAFPTFLIYTGLLVPVMLLMPASQASPAAAARNVRSGDASRSEGSTLWLAAGTASLAIAYTTAWPFFLLLGEQAGLGSAHAGMAASACLVFALAGSSLSSRLTGWFGRGVTIVGAVVLVGAGVANMVLVKSVAPFLAGGFAALFGLYAMVPAVLGAAAAIDRSGRGAAKVNASILLAGGAGPYLGGLLISQVGIASIGAVAVIAATVSAAIFLKIERDTAMG